jgi:hypothetical protein
MFSRKPRDGTATAVAERVEKEESQPAAEEGGLLSALADNVRTEHKKKEGDEELEYEWEFETPFGKVELEIEPRERKEEKERKKREKVERDEAKKAARMAKRAERAAKKAPAAGEAVVARRGSMLPILIVLGLIVAGIVIAIWLFARPEEEEQVPEQYRNQEAAAASTSEGLGARIRRAIRAGRRASREAQEEQQSKFEEATKQR